MSKQQIYKTLIQSGMTREAALGMLGNWQCESGLEANRLQGDFSSFRTLSKTYVARATNGDMSKEEFCKPIGIGLAQWTYHTREAALWDFWKQSGKALDDPVMQTQFAIAELKKDYRNLWDTLCTNKDLYTCTKLICTTYERPAHNNIDQRFTAAVALKAELTDTPAPAPEPATEVFWPPRMVCKGMKGNDIIVLQALLLAHGFDCGRLDGEFDERTKNRVLAYQAENGLDTDGIAGKMTFGSLVSF